MTVPMIARRWTGDMADVAALCGDEVAAALAATVPGLYLWVCREPRQGSALARLEPWVIEALVCSMPSQHIYVSRPRIAAGDIAREAARLRGEGESIQAIALALGVSERRVYRCLKGGPTRGRKLDGRQGDLFSGAL